MNFRNKKNTEQRQRPLAVKYRWKGMSKTNYRKLNKRIKGNTFVTWKIGNNQSDECDGSIR